MVESKKTFFNFAWLVLALIVLLSAGSRITAQSPLSQPPGPSGQEQKPAFDDRAATKLLTQLTQGLENGNQKQVLASFNFVHMQDGERYQQQFISFLGHAESIRLHVNLVSTVSDAAKPVVEADFEMEITPRDGTLPVRRQARLDFAVESASNGWKFVDVQPRDFFSTDTNR